MRFHDTDISDLFTVHANAEQIKEYIRNLAAAITNENVIIDLDVSVFGGGVIAMKDFPKEELEKCIYDYARRPCPQGSLRFVYVQSSQLSGVRGAGIYAYRRLRDPSFI